MDTATPREASMLSLIPKGPTGGAGISTIGALSHNDVIALAGFGIAVLSFLINLFFQIRKDRRDNALHTAQISAIKKE